MCLIVYTIGLSLLYVIRQYYPSTQYVYTRTPLVDNCAAVKTPRRSATG